MTSDPSSLRVTALQPDEDGGWEALVSKSASGSLYHTLRWRRILEASFGFKAHYLVAYRGGVPVDGLPLVSVSKPVLGEKLISLPHSGGHDTFLGIDTSVHRQLIDQAVELARDRRVRYLELRSRENLGLPSFEVRQAMLFPVVPLHDPRTNFSQLSENHRRSVRRAQREGVTVSPSYDRSDLQRFYRIMARQNQRFGSPMFPFRYFDALWRELEPGRLLELLLLKRADRLIGGGMFFTYKDKIFYKYGACLASELAARPYHALLWRAIELGLERRLAELELGAVSIGDEGLQRFKRHWGAEMRPAHFHYLAVTGKTPRVEDYFDSYGWAKVIWRHLPQSVVRVVGPRILEWVC